MSVREEVQGGRTREGIREEEEEEDVAGYSKRVREEEAEGEDIGCSKKRRRIRSENWSAKETLQLLELRKAIAETSIAKGSDAWKQIARQLAAENCESQARSSKQVAQRWDTLVKVYVSVEEQCCESGRSYVEVISDRQKRCKTEYRQLWHELIAQGNPGKRRAGRTGAQPDDTSNGAASQAVTLFVRKSGEIAKSLAEMVDSIDRYITASEERSEANKDIVTGSNWESEDDQGLEATIFVSRLKKRQDATKAEVARATQSMADTMQSISMVASTSEVLCLEADQKDWSMAIQRLCAFSQRFQTINSGIRDAYVCDPNLQRQTVSAVHNTQDHANNSIQHSLSLTSSFYINGKICKRTSLSSLNTKRSEKSCSSGKRDGGSTPSPATSETYAGLQDIVHLSPKSDCESLSGSRWLEADRTNRLGENTWTTSSVEKEKLRETKDKKERTESRTSILKFRQRLALEEVGEKGEKGSRNMTRTMTRFGPRVQGLEELHKHSVE